MASYSQILDAYLGVPEHREDDLAKAIGSAQATVNRYRNGKRFPDAGTARAIDKATGGQVPFASWQAEFLDRSGIAA